MSEQKVKIPEQGVDHGSLLAEMQKLRGEDVSIDDNRLWGMIYKVNEEHSEFLKKCVKLFFYANGLSPVAFPSLKRFENEVVAMTADLLGGDGQASGTMTSGGTESILLAVKAYRDWARKTKPEIERPEILLPITAHPAFEKACYYFDLTSVHIPVGDDYRADIAAAKELINDNTILVVGSAPQYPHGVIDPIESLAALALERGIGMHVDACVGGFLLPWLRELGKPIPPFDFSVAGVTSMSADLHKYGYVARGASTIIYRNSEWRRHQFFAYSGWPGGYYASPSIPGSRPGGIIAAAWGGLMAMGRDGYLKFAKISIDGAQKLMSSIEAIEGLKVLGKPDATVFCFGSDELDMLVIADKMDELGWATDRLTEPSSLHMVVTPAHVPVIDNFLEDLKGAAQYARDNPEASKQGMAAIYGMMAQIPEQADIDKFVLQYLDDMYKL
jgi:sphinganine-1-phosphate aldolase